MNAINKYLGQHKSLFDGLNLSEHTNARTEFQLRHFVIGQHDMPERQWSQAICEIKAGRMELARLLIDREKTFQSLQAQSSPDPELELKMISLEECIRDRVIDLGRLIKIAHELKPCTDAELEANEENYWHKRLLRQAQEDKFAAMMGVSVGNQRAIKQIGGLIDPKKLAEPNIQKCVATINDFLFTINSSSENYFGGIERAELVNALRQCLEILYDGPLH